MTRTQLATFRLSRSVFAMILALSGCAVASSNPWVIHAFAGGARDGYRPFAGLIADAAGNLYGTTDDGGESPNCYSYGNTGCGTVFELLRPTTPDGIWTENVLYNFQGGTDGAGPLGGVIFDRTGNFYGTTSGGGENAACPNCGTVFELTPPSTANGAWTETVLYRFQGGSDGGLPIGSLVFDKAGNLYGTTPIGGIGGTVFELNSPSSSGGTWTETVIYSFTGEADGDGPQSGLIVDQGGALYGTTFAGGDLSCDVFNPGCGVIFRLSPPTSSGGHWSERVLYAFGSQPRDAKNPSGTLVFDATGNLYGTAENGGTYGLGAIFELTRPVHSLRTWTETVLHSFAGGKDGVYPQNNLAFDGQGALYGVTQGGGGGTGGGACTGGCGTVFKLVPPATLGGTWTEQMLHRFGYQLSDGFAPTLAGLIRVGNTFYGTTTYGGGDTLTCPIGCGTVFQIHPLKPIQYFHGIGKAARFQARRLLQNRDNAH